MKFFAVHSVVLGAVFCLSLFSLPEADNLHYSPFNCGNGPWPLDFNNSAVLSEAFSKWIFAWEFNCDKNKAKNGISFESAGNGGIGSSFMFASKYFMKAIELRQIYRPMHGKTTPWVWADPTGTNCTSHIQSYDCWGELISDCGVSSLFPRNDTFQQHVNTTRTTALQLLKPLDKKLYDICSIAKLLKKTVKWVHGHLMMYLARLRPDMQATVNQRVKNVFANLPSDQVTIAVQLRTGSLDTGRTAIRNMTYVMTRVDEVVTRVQQMHNKTVAMVYLCSNDPQDTFISPTYMSKHYPRPFQYRTSPVTQVTSQDFEYVLKYNKSSILQQLRPDLMVDFFTDVEVLAKADFVLGSTSNVYMVSAAFRAARRQHSTFPNNTCYFESRQQVVKDFPVFCEGSPQHKKLWSFYFAPAYTHFENE